jgi:cytochrome c2
MLQFFLWGARCKTGLPDLHGFAARGVNFASVKKFSYSASMQLFRTTKLLYARMK